MSATKDWSMLMLGFVLLGFLLATVTIKRDYEARLNEQRAKYELAIVKKHMTTILQLNDCFINEAFYTLDREIFESKKRFEQSALPESLRAPYKSARRYILDYYERFNMQSSCDDCVPRSPMPVFQCTAA